MPNAGIVVYHGNYSLTATPTITGESGTFNSPSGLSIDANGVIDKNASTAGTYSVEYTTTGSCPITVTNSITITALDNATFAYGSSAYCNNVSDPTPTKSASGTFSSSTGLNINTSTGEVDLDASTAGTYVIGFVTSGSCPNSSIQTLTINAAPTVAISGTLSYCAGSNTTLTATAGLSSYLWSSGETTQSITATAGSYTVTGTDANGCSTTSSSVTVTETPLDNAGFSYSASSYTTADADPTPTITGLTGGTFSAGSGLVFVDSGTNTGSSTGEIDLSASTVASYTITYDTTSSGSSVCPNTSTFSLAVTASYSPFQMQFDVSGGKTISLNSVYGSSFYIDWGDGNTETNTGGINRTITHTYASGLTNKTISIGSSSDSGPLEKLRFTTSGSDLLDIPQWGSTQFTSLNNMFTSCNNTSFQISASDTPNLLSGASMDETFYNADYFNTDISNWDVSNVTGGLLRVFGSANSFNQNLSSWDIQSGNLYLFFWATSMSTENYTDTIVGWAVTVYKNSGKYSVSMGAQYSRVFDNSRTSDNASGQTYAAKYGSDWTATGWTDAGDARDYLTGATANWTISGDSRIN